MLLKEVGTNSKEELRTLMRDPYLVLIELSSDIVV